MPRPKKRVRASRRNASTALSAAKRKKIRVDSDHGQLPEPVESEGPGDELSQPISGPASSDSEQQLQVRSEVEIRDAEDDILELAQPDKGWKEAERTAAGCSKINAGKTPQPRW